MRERKKIKQAIIVEGKYDKIKVLSIIDAIVIETNGFRIFKESKKVDLIRRIAKTKGVIIFTDSDSGGFMIRNYLKGCIKEGEVLHAYIPDVFGKERRKSEVSKEGKLGVEGVPEEVILNSLESLGIGIDEGFKDIKGEITKLDLYNLGLSGKADSEERRQKLIKIGRAHV